MLNRVLPSCDIPFVASSRTVPLRRSVNDLRSAWMQAGDPSEDMFNGVPFEILRDGQAPRWLAVGIQHKVVFFDLPLRGEFTLAQATAAGTWGNANASYERWARGDWTADGRDDVLVAQMADEGPSIVAPPVPSGIAPVRSIAAVIVDNRATLGFPRFDSGDWNGDGTDDLLVAWETGDVFLGTRYPPLPYPMGGAAVYTGPIAGPWLHLVDESPPAAWYDGQPPDVLFEQPPHSGFESRLISDVDRDGRDDVLLSGGEWGNLAERSPPVPTVPFDDPPNMGGFAVFSGGVLGSNPLGSERTLLAATCRSDQSDVFSLETPTEAHEVGDVDGDGIPDLALVADHVEVPNGRRDVVFLVTRLPSLTGLHTYTEASDAIIVNVSDVGGSFQDVASAGDLNGDGADDLAISVWEEGVFVLLSPFSGFLDLASAALEVTPNAQGGGGFGHHLGFGDIDGDSIGDLVISDDADRGCCGAVHVVSGQTMRDALGL